MIKQTLHN